MEKKKIKIKIKIKMTNKYTLVTNTEENKQTIHIDKITEELISKKLILAIEMY